MSESKKRIRFYTPEMRALGVTRWFENGELPSLDWSKVSAIEISEEMTVDQFKIKFPFVKLPEATGK